MIIPANVKLNAHLSCDVHSPVIEMIEYMLLLEAQPYALNMKA
jgi:hypothetical protein